LFAIRKEILIISGRAWIENSRVAMYGWDLIFIIRLQPAWNNRGERKKSIQFQIATDLFKSEMSETNAISSSTAAAAERELKMAIRHLRHSAAA
jgi:glycine cleavage system regulatory protein